MEFLQISEAKLKIVMNEKEVVRYGLSDVQESGSSSRRAIWQIMDLAKKNVGFDPAGDKILVQFYPTKSSGCELFVTKLGILNTTSAKLVTKSDNVTLLSRRQNLYLFSSHDSLVSALTALKFASPSTLCTLYTDRQERFALALEEHPSGADFTEFHFLSEFAPRLSDQIGVYIEEHFEKLCDFVEISKIPLEEI